MQNSPAGEPSLFGMHPEKGRWVLVVFGLIINLCLGTVYSWSVFVNPLTDYFTTTLGQTVTANEVLLPYSVILAVFAITMALTGRYVETHGPRKITIIGCILTGLGWLFASTVSSIAMLSVMYGVIGGIGIGIAYGATVAVAARWFPDRQGARGRNDRVRGRVLGIHHRKPCRLLHCRVWRHEHIPYLRYRDHPDHGSPGTPARLSAGGVETCRLEPP